MGLYTTPRVFVIKRQALLDNCKTDKGEPADTIEIYRSLSDAKRFLELYVSSRPQAWVAKNKRVGRCFDQATDRLIRIYIKRRMEDT